MKMSRFTLPALALAGVMLAMPGCKSEEKTANSTSSSSAAAMGAMNDKCPISGGAVDPKTKTVMYNGKEVGFCCGMCPAKWEAMSAADKDKFIAAASHAN